MNPDHAVEKHTNSDAAEFYRSALNTLNNSQVPFLVGGAYAFARYTGIARDTKDLDIFVRPEDCDKIFNILSGCGYHTELTYPHWLAKAYAGEDFIDIIFSSGNGISRVDDIWFTHAIEDKVFGVAVKLSPVEEMIWSKAFIMERERFDGADIAHLLRAAGKNIDWRHLLDRFGPHWRVLLAHLILFDFIYPNEKDCIASWVMCELSDRMKTELNNSTQEKLCQGTLLSRAQYLIDIHQWGYLDARLQPSGNMTMTDTAIWTAAIDDNK